jgi:transposase
VTAIRQKRRTETARDISKRFGVSVRHVRRIVAEPRNEFESRGRKRQDEALALIESGLTYQEAADHLQISRGTAAGLVHRARERHDKEQSRNTPAAA